MYLPNIWGEGGALFAFSGMDGETDALHPLIGSTLPYGRGFVFHTEDRPELRFGVVIEERDSAFESVTDQLVSGTVVISQIEIAGAVLRLEYAFLDKSTVGARITCDRLGEPIDVYIQSAIEGAECSVVDGKLVQCVGGNTYALGCSNPSACISEPNGRVQTTLLKAGESVRFAWAYSAEGRETVVASVSRGLTADFDAVVERELQFFRSLPVPKTSDPDIARTYYKCASVMKVNCCSPQGQILFPWTTPDRWPHRWMWIWDSAFHAIGLRHISHKWAEDAIKAVLSVQRSDGFIPHMITVDGKDDSSIIQPPILAWGSWKVYEKTKNSQFLEYVFPHIGKMILYDCQELDTDNNGLSEWNQQYTGGASGMDNSPRFDQPIKDAVDLNSYLVNDMRYLAKIARELGKEDKAREWDELADERSRRINELLWDDETGFYYDNDPNGKLVKIKTEAGFTPLFAGVCNEKQAEALVKHLTNPKEFWRPFPISSVSADEPTFCDNMWRGPTWINFNYFCIEALDRYGFAEVSKQLRKRTIEGVSRWHTLDGIIYEFFDSEGKTNPVFLHRKKLGGPQAVRSATSLGTNVCDYNFTASLFFDLVISDPSLPEPVE